MSATPMSVLTPSVPNRAAELVEMESLMSLDAPIESKVMPRWERKKLQKLAAAGEGGPSGSCAAAGCDRFIPNRSAMHMEKAHYALSKENVGSNPQGEGDGGRGADDSSAAAHGNAGVPTQEAATVEKKGACDCLPVCLPACLPACVHVCEWVLLGPVRSSTGCVSVGASVLIQSISAADPRTMPPSQSTTRPWRRRCWMARRSTACWPSARRRRYVHRLV
jgi:hypothetical protein